MERMEELIELPSVKTTPEEHSRTILESEPPVIEQEIKPQVEVAIVEDDKLQERGEEIVGETTEMEEKDEKGIIEEEREEEVCVEPPQGEKNEPINSCRMEVVANSIKEKILRILQIIEEPHFPQPLVSTLLKIPRCVKLDERLISNKRKLKDLLKKALDGTSTVEIHQDILSKMEETLPNAEEMHRVLKRRRSDPSNPSCAPEQEPNPESSRHAATNFKADERVP